MLKYTLGDDEKEDFYLLLIIFRLATLCIYYCYSIKMASS